MAKTGSYKKGVLSGLRIYGYVSSPTDLSGMDFSEMNLRGMVASLVTLGNANFTGADLRGSGFSSYFTDTSGAIYKNTIMSNGEINNISFNFASDVPVVRTHETNVEITESAELSAGSIELLDDAKLEVINGVTASISYEFIISFASDVSGVDDLLQAGDNSTIVMAGYNSNAEAQAAFIGLFKDSDGNGVDWAPDTVFRNSGRSKALYLCGNILSFGFIYWH